MISFCVTVKGRRAEFTNCVRSLVPIMRGGCGVGCPSELIIGEWADSHPKVATWLPVSATTCVLSGKFSRGRGLNAAARVARYPYLFFIDADMILGFNVVRAAVEVCNSGAGFFPICWSYRDREHVQGYWREEGYGITALPRDLFTRCGGWDEFTQWGGEDRKMYARTNKIATTVRRKYTDLVHQWHPVVM